MRFSNLNIKTKLILTTSLVLIGAVLSITGYIVYQLQTDAQEEAATFHALEIDKRKQILKNYVDIAYTTIDSNFKEAQDNAYLIKRYGQQLQNTIDIAQNMIQNEISLIHTTHSNVAEAQKVAKARIREISFDDGKGYVWINDMGKPFPKMIMHPKAPQLNGVILNDPKYNCALGRKENLFKAFVDICEKKGEGFVDYMWPKPTKEGLTQAQPKLSYVRLIKAWNWVIGTGIYVDDALDDALSKTLLDIQKMRYDDHQRGYFWINTMDRPYPKMVMHPLNPALTGQVLDDPQYNLANNQQKNLFQAFVDVCAEKGEGYVAYLWDKPIKGGGTLKNAPKLSYVRLYAPLNWVIGTGVYTDDIDTEIKKKATALTQRIWELILRILGLVILILALAFFLISYTTHTITHPLSQIKHLADKISKGDLTVTVAIHSKDELGHVGESLNQAVRFIRAMLAELQATMLTLTQSSETLKTTSEGLTAQAKQMDVQSDQVASSSDEVNQSVGTVASTVRDTSQSLTSIAGMAEEMSITIQNVSSAMQQTAGESQEAANASDSIYKNINDVAAAIEEMTKSLEEVARNTAQANDISQQANQQTEDINQRMDTLSTTSKQIGKIIGVIKDIANQTNMLALNATIEAAGAGDAGKGFAVVAGEVKELAKHSAEATDEITEQISKIQTSTETAVEAISQISIIINEIANINQTIATAVEEQTATMNHIAKNISGNAQFIKTVSLNATESASRMSEMDRSAGEIARTVQEVTQSVVELEAGVKNVVASSVAAANSVNQITENIQHIRENSKATLSEANHTNFSSKELEKIAGSLSEMLSRFKV